MRNGAKHVKDVSPYNRAVGNVLDDLITDVNGFNCYSSYEQDGVGAYGHGACNGELSHKACGNCIDTACNYLNYYCSSSVEALIQFEDCGLRYENYPFIE